MINTELATLMNLLQQFLWPFIRIAAFLLVSPLYSIEAFTVRLRIALAMVLVCPRQCAGSRERTL
jgi:flagellar biosynthesis protein FliR